MATLLDFTRVADSVEVHHNSSGCVTKMVCVAFEFGWHKYCEGCDSLLMVQEFEAGKFPLHVFCGESECKK